MGTRRLSAGLLMYRRAAAGLEVFLAHPGGPFFSRKDDGVWTLPKGEISPDEDPLPAALREWREETGTEARPPFLPLGEIKQKGGKVVRGWAFAGAGDDPPPVRSNTFSMEWPPGSGRTQEFPEIDRGQYFDLETARRKLNPAQVAFLDRLLDLLKTA